MHTIFFRGLLTLTIALVLFSGCAKEQVKPDEGIAADKPAVAAVPPTVQPQKQPEVVPSAPIAEQLRDDMVKADAAARPSLADDAKGKVSAAAFKAGLATIVFDFDSYALSQSARDTLYNNAEYLLKKYRDKVILEGHCDERGSDEYNLALGEKRAKSVMNYLLTLGVPAEQLSVVSYGKERPADNGHTEEAWAKNRRVEFEPAK